MGKVAWKPVAQPLKPAVVDLGYMDVGQVMYDSLSNSVVVATHDGMHEIIPVSDLVDTFDYAPGTDMNALICSKASEYMKQHKTTPTRHNNTVDVRQHLNSQFRSIVDTIVPGSVVVICADGNHLIHAVVHRISFNTQESVPALNVEFIYLRDIVDDIDVDSMTTHTVVIHHPEQIRLVTKRESAELFKKFVTETIEETKNKMRELKKTYNELLRLRRRDASNYADQVRKHYSENLQPTLTAREMKEYERVVLERAQRAQRKGIYPPFG